MAESIVRRNDPNAITPFWNRIPQFFLFPLSPQPLLFMLGVAAALLLASLLPPLRLPIAFLAVLGFLRYCYAVLDRAAFGLASTPRLDSQAAGVYRPWKQLAVLLVYGLMVAFSQAVLGTIAAHAIEYTLLLLLPANVMWLGLTNSLLASLNVVKLFGLMRAIGWPYLALCVFVVLLSAAADTVSYFLMFPLGSTVFAVPAFALAQMYFILITFNMLGYALYQYRERLGLRPVGENAKAAPATFNLALEVRRIEAAPATLDARIKQLLDARQPRAATNLTHELARLNPDNRHYNERYRSVLEATGNHDLLVRHAAQYVEVLLKAGDTAAALELYRASRRSDPSFHLQEAEAQLALARAATNAGEDQLAVEMIQDFDLTYPLSDERAAAYLLGARLLNERYQNADEARRLIGEMLRKFPATPLAAEARAYLARLA